MIATGGLLRISRRQDSLRSKNRAENKKKRKAKKKRKNDVVVVKGKVKLCSVSGLVAAMGILILLVGIAMAAVGYWPRESSEYPEKLPEKIKPMKQAAKIHGKPWGASNFTSNNKFSLQRAQNSTDRAVNSTEPTAQSVGFFESLFASYLYSDNLKVFGPLVMGIGIFLFICANAVLHEDRDKKTKIINLRDIYSTVIDIHSLRTKDCAPFNGLISYMQSRSAEAKSGSSCAGTTARGSWPSTISGKGGNFRRPSYARKYSWCAKRQSFTDTVYSIYRDHGRGAEASPAPRQWETRSIVTSSVNAFTLPVIKLNNCEMEEREERERACMEKRDPCTQGEELQVPRRKSCGPFISTAVETRAEVSRTCMSVSQDFQMLDEGQTVSLAGRGQLLHPTPGTRVMGSHLSLNALCDLGARSQDDRSRRFSCPRLDRSGSKGYIKLTDLGGESFETPDGTPDAGVRGTEEEETHAVHTLLDNSDKHLHTHSASLSNTQMTIG